MSYKYIFFDLDGTLTDSQEGILNCVEYALESSGIHEPDRNKLRRFMGPPLMQSFAEFYGFSPEQAREATEKYRERFATVGLFENKPFEGVYDMLQALINSAHVLAVATSKPLVYTNRILLKYRLRPYFKFVSGAELDGTRDNKNEVIEYAIEKLGCPRDKMIMVGDRKQDIIGAKKCGVASCGVRWGYAEPDELEAAGADYIAENMDDLLRMLL